MINQIFKWLNRNKSVIEQYYSIALKAQDLFIYFFIYLFVYKQTKWSSAKKVNAEK